MGNLIKPLTDRAAQAPALSATRSCPTTSPHITRLNEVSSVDQPSIEAVLTYPFAMASILQRSCPARNPQPGTMPSSQAHYTCATSDHHIYTHMFSPWSKRPDQRDNIDTAQITQHSKCTLSSTSPHHQYPRRHCPASQAPAPPNSEWRSAARW